jgi:uncharacterized delta-60 repeat protein
MRNIKTAFFLLIYFAALPLNAQFSDSFDLEFGNQGILIKTFETDFTPIQMAVLSNDEILVVGRANFGNDILTIAKFDANGQNLISAYGNFNGFSQFGTSIGGLNIPLRPTDMAVLPDESVIINGTSFNITTSKFELFALKLTPQGSLDQQFGTNGITTISILNFLDQGINTTGSDIALSPDGAIFITGAVSTSQLVVAKLNSSGQLDTSFGTNGLVRQDNPLPSNISRVEVDIFSDGRICVATEEEIYPNGFQFPNVAPSVYVYLPNGDIDPNFIQGVRELSRNITLDNSNQITIEYEDFYPGEMRINEDDIVFFSGSVRDDDEETIDFGSYLISILPNGEYNTSIGVNPEFDTLITEERISVPGMIALATARDEDDYTYSFQFLEDGNMLILGSEYSFNGNLSFVKQIDETGNPILEFANQSVFRYQNVLDNFDEGILASEFQSNGELLLLSRYTNEQGKLGMLLTRLGENGVLGQTNAIQNIPELSVFPNPTNSILYINGLSDKTSNKIEVLDLSGKRLNVPVTLNSIDVSSLSNGIYILEIQSEGFIQHIKIIRN